MRDAHNETTRSRGNTASSPKLEIHCRKVSRFAAGEVRGAGGVCPLMSHEAAATVVGEAVDGSAAAVGGEVNVYAATVIDAAEDGVAAEAALDQWVEEAVVRVMTVVQDDWDWEAVDAAWADTSGDELRGGLYNWSWGIDRSQAESWVTWYEAH